MSATPETDFEHRYLILEPGRRLHCVQLGSGQPVLLIPGWPQTWYTWRHVMKALARQGYQAIAVDLPGTGLSDPAAEGHDTGNIAALLHRAMGQLGHQRYRLAGHDVGMWVGYALASDYPDAVSQLVLSEAVIPGLAEAPPIFVSAEQNIFIWHFLFNQLQDLPEALISGREDRYLTFMFERWAHHVDRVAVDTYIKAYSKPGGLSGGLAYYRSISQTIAQNRQRAGKRLNMPVLAIGAEHATGEVPLQTLQAHADNLRGSVITDCGHFVMEEADEAFSAQVLAFFEAN